MTADVDSTLGGRTASSTLVGSFNLRIIGGYKFNENISVEAGYTKTSGYKFSFAGTNYTNESYTGSTNYRYSGLDVSALFRPSVASGYNNFFATLGSHSYKAKASSIYIVNSTNYSESDSSSGTGPMYGICYDWKLNKFLDLRLAVNRINKIGGVSDFNVTNFGIILIENY